MADDQVRAQQHITLAAAMTALHAGLDEATSMGVKVSVCVTDANGNMVICARMDGAHVDTDKGAQKKAVFAARMGRSTEEFIEKRLKQDDMLWRAMSQIDDVFLVPGGIPMEHDGTAVGGVGVSGAKYEQDTLVAAAVAAAYSSAQSASPA